MVAPSLLAGRFEVLGRLGAGSSGEVLRVRDRDGGREFALKLLHPRGGTDPGHLARAFHREFLVLAALRHPHLVAVHEHGVVEPSPGDAGGAARGAAWFTMDLVPGRPIDQALRGADGTTIARVADALLDALGALHRRGLLHGDVKAANILVGDALAADPPPVTLVDLGLVARAGRSEPGVLRGTPATLAPETLRGGPLDGRTDLYALGCVLYRVVTGQDPFLGDDAWAVARAHLSLAPTRPRDLAPGVAPLLEQLVLALLEKDPARRPPTAEEARRRLAPLSGAAAAPAVALTAPLGAELVGRRPQLAAWRDALAAEAGRGGGVFALRGEGGSGRSRLLEEFLLEAHASGRAAVLVAAREVPPRPLGLVDAIEQALARHVRGAAPADAAATRVDRLAARLADEPLVLLIDDADRADPASREVLQTLTAECASGALPALVALALGRGDGPEGTTFALPPAARELPLPPLEADESARALASMLGVAALPPAWPGEVAAATAGRPGAIAALAEGLVSTGRIGPELPFPPGLDAALAGARATAVLPETPGARALLAALAVAGGGPLPLAELERLEPRAARDDEALDALLAGGSVRRLVDADGGVAFALASRVSAADALALVSPAALAALHARRAEQLTGTAGGDEERGRHLAAIGRMDEASALLAAAAGRALEDGLPRAASRLAEEALALPGTELDAARAAGLRRTRAVALAALGFPREAEAEAARAIESARAAAEPRAIADALRSAAGMASARGDRAAAVAYLEEALALLDELGEVGLGAEVLLEEGRTLARAGRAGEAETRLASALGQARRARRGDVEAAALVALGELALGSGRSGDARERFQAAEERARAAGGAAAVVARRGRALALEAAGRIAEALEEARLLWSEARAAHRVDDDAEAAALTGRLLARLGRRREAQQALQAAAARRRRLGQPHEAAMLAAREALLLLERGQSRAALALAQEARAEAERCGVEGALGECRAALATIAAARGELEEVESLLPARADARPAEQAQRALLRGRALVVRGDGEAARGALQEGCFLARRAGDERLELEGLLALAEVTLERGGDERRQLALRRARQAAEAAGWDEGVAQARLLAAEGDLARGRSSAAAARDEAHAAAELLAAHERGDLIWRALAAEAEAARLADAAPEAAALARDAQQALEGWLAAAPEADRTRLAAHPRARALALTAAGLGPAAPPDTPQAGPDAAGATSERTLHE
ncbi:MAG: serine/threonine-protein kinase, partial [Solirubrobacteraceae bacterium]|nr:serine/threonine-protein kinase [Solirubrobacteraceae bacterium]